METVFRGEEMPGPERFERWRELVCANYAPTEIHTDHAAHFHATFRLLDLGPVRVCAFTCPPLRSSRTPELIRQSDPETYCLCLLRQGHVLLSQAGRETFAGAGDLVLSTTSLPCEDRLAADQGSIAVAQILIPRALLPLREARADRLLAVRLPGRKGVGALLAQFLTRLATDPAPCRTADLHRLGVIALDLAGVVLAHHLEPTPAMPPESHRHALTMHVQTFIHRHLADPGLTPGAIAAAHHLSLRSLHRLFEHQGTTVVAFIRHHRLERTRRDLADPLMQTRPIHALAARWGFTRPGDFTRAFRTAYSTTPSEYRHTALRLGL